MKVLKYLICISLLLLLYPSKSFSAKRVELDLGIVRQSFVKIPIGIMNISNKSGIDEVDRVATEILKNDLALSGLFTLIDLDPIGVPSDSSDEPLPETIRKAGRRGLTFLIWGKLFWRHGSFALEGRIFDASTGKLVSGKRYLGEQRILRKMTHKLSDEIVYQYTGEKGIAQTQILYVSQFDGREEIFMMDYDGHNPVRVTGDQSIKIAPSWSPSGRNVTYTTYKDGNPDIFSLDITTGRREKLVSFDGLNMSPAWSADGSMIAFSTSKDGNSEIYLTDSEGSRFKRLTFNSLSDISPSWSPAGNELVFVSDRTGAPQLYLMDKNGTNLRRLTFKGGYNTNPDWSVQGGNIVYSCRRNGRNKICYIAPDKSIKKQVTYGPGNDESPGWAPNGRNIVFSSSRKGKKQIFIVANDGTHLVQLTHGASENYFPAWSAGPID